MFGTNSSQDRALAWARWQFGTALAVLVVAAAPTFAAGSSSSASSSSSSSYGNSSASAETEDAAALMAEAIEFNEKGWFRRAVGNLRKVTKLEPNNADAWNELGFAYRNVENYNQSARAYDRALSLEANHLATNTKLDFLRTLYYL